MRVLRYREFLNESASFGLSSTGIRPEVEELFDSKKEYTKNVGINEALKTKCQTKGAVYKTKIKSDKIEVDIELPFELELPNSEAKLLEKNIHNMLELVLKPYFINKKDIK